MSSVREDMEQLEFSYPADDVWTGIITLENALAIPTKCVHTYVHTYDSYLWFSNAIPRYTHPPEMSTYTHKVHITRWLIVVLLERAEHWKQI